MSSIAVVKADFHDAHSTSWGEEWMSACREKNISCVLVDWRKPDAFEELLRHKVVLWHFSHYSADEMKFARPILDALSAAGCLVYPGRADADHFDDKVAQAYLLRSLGVRTPKNYVFHSRGAVDHWIRTESVFPVVAKLRSGSGSSNVVMIRSADELRSYASRMFGLGFRGRPDAIFKIRSNLSSSRSLSDIFRRVKRAPEFFFSWRKAGQLAREAGYVYLQEFIPSVSYDLKVVVVGDRLSFIGRRVRAGDFRASGGGDLFYDRSYMTPEVIDFAFDAASRLKSECTGFDIVVDPRSGNPVVLEVSYGFSHKALLEAGGFFDRKGQWHSTPLNAPRALLERLLDRL